MNRRVVITGVGAVPPLGVGADALMDRWTAAESGIVGGLGACREFDPLEHLSKKEARRSDRFAQLAIVSADEALEHSGGNRTRAAEALGISRFGLQKMTQRLNIDVDSKVQKSGRIRARGLDERS